MSGARGGIAPARIPTNMTPIRLSSHASFGLVGDRPVFLDLKRDRYLTLEGDAALAFGRIRTAQGWSREEDAARLVATGLFETCEQAEPIAPARAPATRAQLELDGSTRAFIRDGLAVWRLLRRVNRELRRRPLLAILADRLALPPSPNAASADEVAALARRFRRARQGAPITPRCLPDSLALWDWLRARGATCSIVFGVKLDPFGAHCWVQHGGTALNEAVDRAAEYTPVHVFQ